MSLIIHPFCLLFFMFPEPWRGQRGRTLDKAAHLRVNTYSFDQICYLSLNGCPRQKPTNKTKQNNPPQKPKKAPKQNKENQNKQMKHFSDHDWEQSRYMGVNTFRRQFDSRTSEQNTNNRLYSRYHALLIYEFLTRITMIRHEIPFCGTDCNSNQNTVTNTIIEPTSI